MDALAGKSIVVTGAGRGLGAAYARLAAREGAAVVVNDVDGAAAERVAGEIRAAGGSALAVAADIGDWEAGAGLVRSCIDEFGRIDGLVNNAGTFYMARPDEETHDRVNAIIRVNIAGTACCGLHALRAMQAQGGGAIVNVTSGSQAGYAGMAMYGATKGAVASLTYGWACDVAGTGIRVNAIAPIARTRMYDEMLSRGDPRAARSGIDVRPEENAAVAVFLLSDMAEGINGQILRVDIPRLSIMTHPGELSPPAVRDAWTVDDVRQAFETEFRGCLQPLGVRPGAGADL